MLFELSDIIKLFSCSFLILILVFLISRAQRKPSTLFIILFFLAQLIVISLHLIFKNYDFVVSHMPFLGYLFVPFWFLWGPTMYLYIVADHYVDYKIKLTDILHFFPFIVLISYFTITFYLKPIDVKRTLLTTDMIIQGNQWKIVSYIVIIQILSYNSLAAIKIQKFSQSWNFGNLNKNRIKWNKFILFGYFSTCIIYDITTIIHEFYTNAKAYFLISDILFFLYFFIIVYKALTSQNLFSVGVSHSKRMIHYKKEKHTDFGEKLSEYMKIHKPYLEFELTLKNLASALNVQERILSAYIRTYKNQGFYDFVNTYRINEAVEIMERDPGFVKTIQEIMYDCGFNSKSSFNTTFKRITGCTPSEYRSKIKPAFSYN